MCACHEYSHAKHERSGLLSLPKSHDPFNAPLLVYVRCSSAQRCILSPQAVSITEEWDAFQSAHEVKVEIVLERRADTGGVFFLLFGGGCGVCVVRVGYIGYGSWRGK